MKRLAIFTNDPNDATSYYRAMGPFSRLREQIEFEPVFLGEVSWATLAWVDAVFMHRPFSPQHHLMIRMAKAMHKKVWVDHDDDLTCIPEDNPNHNSFMDPKIQECIAGCIEMADVVTASTIELAQSLTRWNQHVEVIPNALNMEVTSTPKAFNQDTKTILWRGSTTHIPDLYAYATEIISALTMFPDWRIVFLGMRPFFIINHLDPARYTIQDNLDLLTYFELISKINPNIVLVPLEDNKFNRCKSNIAWIEGTLAGASCLVPDWPEWKECTYRYWDQNSFLDRLKEMMSTPESIKQDQEKSVLSISKNLLLGGINSLRERILKKLFGG